MRITIEVLAAYAASIHDLSSSSMGNSAILLELHFSEVVRYSVRTGIKFVRFALVSPLSLRYPFFIEQKTLVRSTFYEPHARTRSNILVS
jgi:hypothetical protein